MKLFFCCMLPVLLLATHRISPGARYLRELFNILCALAWAQDRKFIEM
jgi:hypothetical protein